MARKIRLFLENTAQHVLLRGNNQENIFNDQEDFLYGIDVFKELSSNLPIQLHAYILMPNHIHLLCTPLEKDALSRFMQGFGIKYVAYFNKKYNRTGTLWEGRYRSSLVENRFILPVMQYIESNAIRAKLCKKPHEYIFSSFFENSKDNKTSIVTPHRMYELLAATQEERQRIYNTFFESHQDDTIVQFIQGHIGRQTITGTEEFYQEISQLIGNEIIKSNKVGRPKKNNPQRNGMYQNLVVLDKQNHKNLKISPLTNLNFAKELTATPLVASEIALVGKDFPVVFTSGDATDLVALTSLNGSNLAINQEGKYIVAYVPAFLRRYPFALAANQENPDQHVIMIDEGAECVSNTKGKQLFSKDGAHSETLSNAITYIQNYENERITTLNIINEIKQSGILEEREISVGEGETKKVLINGFLVINREKLNALSDEILASWVRRGIISFIDAHLNSLSHIQTLFNLAHARQN